MEHHQEDLDTENWDRVFALFSDLAAARSRDARKRTLLITYRGLRLLDAYDLTAKRPVRMEWMGTTRLNLLATRYGFDRILAMEETALTRIYNRAAAEAGPGNDPLKWAGSLYRGLTSEWRRTVFTYPAGPRRMRTVSDAAVRRAVRLFVPDESLLLLAVARGSRAWASIVLGFKDSELKLVTSLDNEGMGDAGLHDGSLAEAARALGEKFDVETSAIAVEHEALERIFASRYPSLSLLWAFNTGNLRLVNVPWRLELLTIATIGLARQRANGVRHRFTR